jgi:hypothetical protein
MNMSSLLTRTSMVLLAICVFGNSLFIPEEAGAESDPKAVEVAHRMMEAMGGKLAWDAQRVLSFRFAVVRDDEELTNWLHFWDRHTGQYRLEGLNSDGEFLRVLFNVNTREGEAWLDSAKVAPEEAEKYLEYGYGRYINDTYWLLMPWKWLDPGVHLAYDGEETLDGVMHDIVHLTFGSGIGITPGDQYWGYVSRESGLMTRWEYLLQDDEGNAGTGNRTAYLWEEWAVIGEDGIKLAKSKVRVADGPRIAITHPMTELYRELDEQMFAPSPPADQAQD